MEYHQNFDFKILKNVVTFNLATALIHTWNSMTKYGWHRVKHFFHSTTYKQKISQSNLDSKISMNPLYRIDIKQI